MVAEGFGAQPTLLAISTRSAVAQIVFTYVLPIIYFAMLPMDYRTTRI